VMLHHRLSSMVTSPTLVPSSSPSNRAKISTVAMSLYLQFARSLHNWLEKGMMISTYSMLLT
ncbi:glycosyl transferase family 1, partial [Sesbania bispinosa]